MDAVGFEPTKHFATDLKSAPFDRSGIRPWCTQWGSNPRPSVHKTDALTNWAMSACDGLRYYLFEANQFFLFELLIARECVYELGQNYNMIISKIYNIIYGLIRIR